MSQFVQFVANLAHILPSLTPIHLRSRFPSLSSSIVSNSRGSHPGWYCMCVSMHPFHLIIRSLDLFLSWKYYNKIFISLRINCLKTQSNMFTDKSVVVVLFFLGYFKVWWKHDDVIVVISSLLYKVIRSVCMYVHYSRLPAIVL